MKIKASNFHTLCERSSFLSTKTMKDLNETNSHPSVNRDPVHERAHCQASPGQVNPDPTRGHVRGTFHYASPDPPPTTLFRALRFRFRLVPHFPFPFPSRPDREALQIEAGEAALARIPPSRGHGRGRGRVPSSPHRRRPQAPPRLARAPAAAPRAAAAGAAQEASEGGGRWRRVRPAPARASRRRRARAGRQEVSGRIREF